MLLLFNCFLTFIIGYMIGRVGHVLGGHLNTPDHWIYGALCFLPGLFWSNTYIFLLFSFGAGLIISDLKDLFELKFYGPDAPGKRRFWGID